MRNKNIDMLRGIAALMAAYFHLSGSSGLSEQTANTGKYGYLGVEIFFVISGFILPYSMHKRKYELSNFGKFLTKRIIRIDPAYFVTIIISILLTLLARQPLQNWKSMIAHLGYLNEILGYDAASPVFWTLAIEFQFYLLIGLAFRLISSNSNISTLMFLSTVLAMSFVLNRAYLPNWFGLFALGILLYRKKLNLISTQCYILSTVALLIFIGFRNGIPEALSGIFALIFIIYFKTNNKILGIKFVLWLGTISYSLYLIHWHLGRVRLAIFRHVTIIGQYESLRLGFGILFTILSAWCLYIFIERPSQRLSNKIRYN